MKDKFLIIYLRVSERSVLRYYIEAERLKASKVD